MQFATLNLDTCWQKQGNLLLIGRMVYISELWNALLLYYATLKQKREHTKFEPLVRKQAPIPV